MGSYSDNMAAKSVEYSTSKAVYHTERISELQKSNPIIPTELQIDLEAFCNDNCSFCSYRKEDGYNKNMLDLIDGSPSTTNKPIGRPSDESRIPDDILLDLPRQMIEAGIPAIEITGGGEPTLHPKFKPFYKALGEREIDIGLVTNGSKLDDEVISLILQYGLWIRISMDSSNPDTHRDIHRTGGFDFERRLNNVKTLAALKSKDLTLGISFIITPQNIYDIEDSAHLYKEIGVDHIRFSWMYDQQGTAGLEKDQIADIAELIPKLQDELNDDNFQVFNEQNRIQLYTAKNDFKKCYYQRFVMAVGADAGCYPCCIMKYNKKYQYANLKESSLAQIVQSMNTHDFMNKLNPESCYPCWIRPRNDSIAKAVEKPTHHNFI